MARLLTLEGDEICSLAHLALKGESFSADVAPHVAAQHAPGEALLRMASGELRRVSIAAWTIELEGGRQVGRVRGKLGERA